MKNRYKIVLVLCTGWLLCVGLAMLLYGGGSVVNFNTNSISLVNNYLSDLGVPVTIASKNNFASALIYNISIVLLAAAMMLTAGSYKYYTKQKWILPKLSEYFLFAAAILLIASIFTPWTTQFREHVLILKLAWVLWLGWCLGLGYVQWQNSKAKIAAIANGVFGAVLLSYILFVIFGPQFGGEQHIAVQTGFQKAVLILAVANLVFQAYTLRKFSNLKESKPKK